MTEKFKAVVLRKWVGISKSVCADYNLANSGQSRIKFQCMEQNSKFLKMNSPPQVKAIDRHLDGEWWS